MEATVANLHKVRADLAKRLSDLQQAASETESDIAAIDRIIKRYNGQFSLGFEPKGETNDELRNMSLREAILHLLSQSSPRPMKAPEIASKLLQAGKETEAKNFKGNIWALLSSLKRQGKVKGLGNGRYTIGENTGEE